MSMPRAVRHINEVRTLEALFRAGPMSRAELARDLGLTRSTASSIVAGLVREGFVAEAAEPMERDGRTGRPGTQVRLNPGHAVFLGADIGVGRCTVVALDLEARVVARAARPFDPASAGPEAVADALAALIRGVVAALADPAALRGLGVAVPGLMDRDGTLLRAPILRWAHVPILRLIAERLPELGPIAAENDANAFAAAELYRAGRAAPREALYVVLDAGVGGGLVSEGRLLRGQEGYAGEIGHVFVGDGGFAEADTLPGALESFVGRAAVLARHRAHGGAAETIEALLAALNAGEAAAAATLADWSHYLGRGLATLVSVLNPGAIVLGGAVAPLFSRAEAAVTASLRRHLLPGHPIPSLALSPLGPDGPAVGAACLLHQRLLTIDEGLVFGTRGETAGGG